MVRARCRIAVPRPGSPGLGHTAALALRLRPDFLARLPEAERAVCGRELGGNRKVGTNCTPTSGPILQTILHSRRSWVSSKITLNVSGSSKFCTYNLKPREERSVTKPS